MIEHISDTARWVAVYRAMESERPDALFRDPYARRLAGERGEAIVREMHRGYDASWAMIVRTAVFDEIITAAIRRNGVDAVVNLAAGLDTRPWRLPLPPALRWVDVDLPAILQYKTDNLTGQQPACRYEAIPADLTDGATRRTLLARLGSYGSNILVVTEGLLIYLTAAQAGELAADIARQPSMQRWLIDLANPTLLAWMNKSWGKTAARGNAPFQFAPAEGTDFFRPFGWKLVEFRSSLLESRRLKREMRGAWIWKVLGRFMSAERRNEITRMSAIVLLGRDEALTRHPV
ncbi:MAG: class I SAM-dependent methyltransferase [Gemmatimonadaceae bacterium]